jgi:hypothetical protein
VAASGLQTEMASRARLEDELSKLLAQKLAARRILRDSQFAAPHGGAEPLDQPLCGGVFGSSSAAASPRPL